MIKIGIIGLGSIAKKAYLPVFSSMDNVEFHLFTRNKTTLNEISQKYRFTHVYTELAALINSGIEAAFVHSTTESHYEIVKELLLHNIHVYVDKPITYDYETTKELVELAESRNLILMTGFNRRFAPLYKAAKEVRERNMVILQKNRHSLPNDARTFIFDDFIHVIDTVRYLFPSEIENVHVTGRKKDHLLYHVVVQFHSKDATGIAIMNRNSGAGEEKLEVMGPDEKRTVFNLSEQVISTNKSEIRTSFNDWDPTLYKRGFEQIIREFIDCVQNNTVPAITGRDALRTHEICENIIKELEKTS
jgi:virulence factor